MFWSLCCLPFSRLLICSMAFGIIMSPFLSLYLMLIVAVLITWLVLLVGSNRVEMVPLAVLDEMAGPCELVGPNRAVLVPLEMVPLVSPGCGGTR